MSEPKAVQIFFESHIKSKNNRADDLEIIKALEIDVPIQKVMQTEIDRIAFIEVALQTAEAAYTQDQMNADNLTMWGSALLEKALYQQPGDAGEMIKDAISKFKEVLGINPQNAEALWCSGNAFTSLAFFTPYNGVAGEYLSEASDLFAEACDAEPDNPLYRKSLEMTAKAPEFHAKFHKQAVAQEEAESSAGVATNKG